MNKRKCTECGEYFAPDRAGMGLMYFCSRQCIKAYGQRSVTASRRRKGVGVSRRPRRGKGVESPLKRERRVTLEVAKHLCRLLDLGQPCISCGKVQEPGEAFHAGHYRTVAAAPHLSCDLRNIHRQCSECNTALSGNREGYIEGLDRRYGKGTAEGLDRRHGRALSAEEAKSLRMVMLDDIKLLRIGKAAQVKWRQTGGFGAIGFSD